MDFPRIAIPIRVRFRRLEVKLIHSRVAIARCAIRSKLSRACAAALCFHSSIFASQSPRTMTPHTPESRRIPSVARERRLCLGRACVSWNESRGPEETAPLEARSAHIDAVPPLQQRARAPCRLTALSAAVPVRFCRDRTGLLRATVRPGPARC